jgi:hypothetical protein
MRVLAWAVLASAICASPVCASDSETARSSYLVTLSAAKSDYKPREDVTLTLTIQNVGRVPIDIWKGCEASYATGITVLNEDGRQVQALPYHIPVLCRGDVRGGDGSLEPAHAVSYQFSLVNDVHVTLPNAGTYTIQMVYNTEANYGQSTFPIKSNTVTINVGS